jgi:hypothetical protein
MNKPDAQFMRVPVHVLGSVHPRPGTGWEWNCNFQLGSQGISWRQLAEITMAKTQVYRRTRSVDLSARLCPACVHPTAEHEHRPQPGCEVWACQHPTCDCEMER